MAKDVACWLKMLQAKYRSIFMYPKINQAILGKAAKKLGILMGTCAFQNAFKHKMQ